MGKSNALTGKWAIGQRCDDAQNAWARDSNKVKAREVQSWQLFHAFQRVAVGRERLGVGFQANGIQPGQHASAISSRLSRISWAQGTPI